MYNIYLKEYIQYEKTFHNKSENTLRAYKKDLEQLIEYLLLENLEDIREIKDINLKTFIIYMKEKNITKRSLNRKISAIKSFFKFLKNKSYIDKDIGDSLENNTFPKALATILNSKDIRELREVATGTRMNDYRDRLIIELLYSSGIRANELLSLSEGLFNFKEREIKVVCKNKNERIVFYSKRASLYLEKYLEAKRKKFTNNYRNDIIFVNNRQERLSDRSLRRIIDRIVKKTNIKKEVSPHTFRHSFGVYMLEHGMNLHYLQELMGHSSIESTKIYLDYNIQEELIEDKAYYNKNI